MLLCCLHAVEVRKRRIVINLQAFCASCAVPDLLLWGSNTNGALGDNTVTSRAYPVAITGLGNVTNVACGGDFTVALNTDGVLYSWGSTNSYGNYFQTTYSSQGK